MKILVPLLFLLFFFSCEQDKNIDIDSSNVHTRSTPGFSIEATAGDPQRLQIFWTDAYKVHDILVSDKYNLFRRYIEPFESSYKEIVILPEVGSYRTDIHYYNRWNPTDTIMYKEILYYNYTTTGTSGPVVDSWTPSCQHDYSRFQELAYLHGSGNLFTLEISCFGEYTMVIKKPNDPLYIDTKNIVHNGPIPRETFSFEGSTSDSFNIRIYSKECVFGHQYCRNYLQLYVTMSTLKSDEIVYFTVHSSY